MPDKFEISRALHAKYPIDMDFAPFSNKFIENVPLKAPWLEAYYRGRATLEHEKRSTRREIRALLDRLGADSSDMIDRYRGALLGVAMGDALGMPLEGAPRDAHIVSDYEAGGPFQLERGHWTDETSMTVGFDDRMVLRDRRNSLFYRTQNGARIGDMFSSLIHTTELHGQNPFEYLTEVLRHSALAATQPADWLPWTYKATLARLGSH
jgi:hypothetical protein